MHVQIVKLVVKPNHVDDFLEAFRINYEGTRQEPGNVHFHLLQDQEDEHRFTVYEVFRSAEALAIHRRTRHYEECVGRFDGVLEGTRTIEVLNPIMADFLSDQG